MARFQNSRAAFTLYDIGISFHAYGELKCNSTGARLYDYYKADSVTDEQAAALRAIAPDVQFFGTRAQYAPEIRGVAIAFPKAAWYRQRAAA